MVYSSSQSTVPLPLKWHGGKAYLASKLVAMMPPHLHYVEPYAGGLSVLLAKDPEGVSEVVNDINGPLSNFWRVLQDDDMFSRFVRQVQAVPFGERHFQFAKQYHDQDPIQQAMNGEVFRAVEFFILCRQSLAGRMGGFATLSRNRVRRGMNEQVSAWLTAVEGLPDVHKRLKRVVVLNRDALDVIRQQDGVNTLFYLDPPYLKETRTSPDVYDHEMSEDQHGQLLEAIGAADFQGKFMLSGYRSELYDDWAGVCNWKRTDFDLPNNSAGGVEKRRMVECVWSNF